MTRRSTLLSLKKCRYCQIIFIIHSMSFCTLHCRLLYSQSVIHKPPCQLCSHLCSKKIPGFVNHCAFRFLHILCRFLCHSFVNYKIVQVCKCYVLDGTLKLYSVSEDRQLHSCSPSSMVGLCNCSTAIHSSICCQLMPLSLLLLISFCLCHFLHCFCLCYLHFSQYLRSLLCRQQRLSLPAAGTTTCMCLLGIVVSQCG